MQRNRKVSATVDVDLSELDDEDIVAEYELRFIKGSSRPIRESDLRDDALRNLRAGRLGECLYRLSQMLGRDFLDLPDALDRYAAKIKDESHARQAA